MSEKFTIIKLTGSENYATWAADLCVVLRHHRHWSWIEGANEQPPPKIVKVPTSSSPTAAASTNVENPAYATWEDGASDALYHIMMTCESNVKDQIRQISVPSKVWKRLKNLYKLSNLSTQFGYLSTIWNISLDNYPLVTAYCSALEIAASNYLASGPTDFAHQLALVALMGLPPSYKMIQCNILLKAGTSMLLLDSIKGDLLTKEQLSVRETKITNAMQVQRQDRPERNT